MTCSIIICTRDRAPMLGKTLDAFKSVIVPAHMRVEMLVVDNGSCDNTAEVVRMAKHQSIEIRLVSEPHAGHSRALNTGIRAARSEVLLFTDDDVEPSANWIEKMAEPLLGGECVAVAGSTVLGRELHRDWLTPMHKIWLAVDPHPSGKAPILIGASMALHRSVFNKIDYFDENLGPGRIGYGGDTMIWLQLREAGLPILAATETYVVHHPDPSRLLRSSWLGSAERFGRTSAYVKHHWEHCRISFPRCRALLVVLKLCFRRLLRGRVVLNSEGCPAWEMSYLVTIAMYLSFINESKNSRIYNLRGLRRNKEALTSPAGSLTATTSESS